MDTKVLIKALKIAVREVIKEELTQILKDGLQSTIVEMTRPRKPLTNVVRNIPPNLQPKSLGKFTGNKWASVLNETDALVELHPSAMNESYDEQITLTSKDAEAFGMMRQNSGNDLAVMENPEDYSDNPAVATVAAALTRDYSELMKTIVKKQGF